MAVTVVARPSLVSVTLQAMHLTCFSQVVMASFFFLVRLVCPATNDIVADGENKTSLLRST